jgi:hypothetical protein
MLPLTLLLLAPAQPQVAPPPRPVGLDPALADWTPRPTGKEAWERATDKDWVDARFRAMDTGPVLNCTMDYPFGSGRQRVYKASVVRFADGKGGAVFDRSTCQLAAAWAGGYLAHSDRRFGLLNTPTPVGKMVFAAMSGPGWANPDGDWMPPRGRFTAPLPKEWVKFDGHSVHGDRVMWSYRIGGVPILETVRWDGHAGSPIARTFYVESHPLPLAIRHTDGGVIPVRPSERDLAFSVIDGRIVQAIDDFEQLAKPGPKRFS